LSVYHFIRNVFHFLLTAGLVTGFKDATFCKVCFLDLSDLRILTSLLNMKYYWFIQL